MCICAQKVTVTDEYGAQSNGWLDGITDSTDTSPNKLLEIVKTGKPGVLQSMGLQRVGYDLAIEQQLSNRRQK